LLIIDPDRQFSAALASEAQSAGLRTICCTNWWEAMGALDGPDVIDAMIVELLLPERTPNGLSAAMMARNRRPRLPVVFTSADPDLLRHIQPGTGPALPKSAGVRRLVHCAVELIEAQGGKPVSPLPHLALSPRISLNPVAKYRLDNRIRFSSVNESALALWRRSRTELLGRPLLEVFPQMGGQPKFQAHLDVLLARKPYVGRLASAVLQEQIDIRIVPSNAGLRVSFTLAA
jgi:hypothetical protein